MEKKVCVYIIKTFSCVKKKLNYFIALLLYIKYLYMASHMKINNIIVAADRNINIIQ